MKYARNNGGHLVDVRVDSPEGRFAPQIVEEFFEVSDDAQDGWIQVNGVWGPQPDPDPSPPTAAVYPQLDATTLYLAFTPEERIAIKTSTIPEAKEFWETYELMRQEKKLFDTNASSFVKALHNFVTAQIIASLSRIPDIQAGKPQ